MTHSPSRGRVLWVDDEPALLQVVSRSLQFFGGFEVVVAGTGYEALDKIRAQPVDCVGTNIKMEPMDGVAMAEAIHRMAPRVPILFLTALTSGWRAAEQAGVCDYMKKPFDVEDLVASVGHAVQLGQGWRSDRLREMAWQERGNTAQAVIDRVSDNLAEVAEACVSTQDLFHQAAEEGRLFSQSYAFTNTFLPACLMERGVKLIDDLEANPTETLGVLWAEAQQGRHHSIKSDLGGLGAMGADYRDGRRVAIITLPGPRHQGEAFLAACVAKHVDSGTDPEPRFFMLEFQLGRDLSTGHLVERCLGGNGAVVRNASCPVDIDVFYRNVERLVATTKAPLTSP